MDRIKTLNKRLKDVCDKFDALKKCGMDEEILVIYLSSKTGLSKKDVKGLLENMEEFYDKITGKDLVENL